MSAIQDFEIRVPEKEIDFLRAKIALTRWPDEINDERWSLGTGLSFLQDLVSYWATEYDWRRAEQTLNEAGSFKFKTSTGLNLHFLHSKSPDPNAIPLIMAHGWPGSVQEFLKIIPLLNQGIDGQAFHVVCPSMPGYGFSDKPTEHGMNSEAIAKLNHELMLALGYEKYIAQGGDWGATVTKWMAELFPENCIGLHLNLVLAFPPENADSLEGLSEDEIEGMENFKKYQEKGYGYYLIQNTKPQSLGYGLHDSPAGLAGWIAEKFQAWTNDSINRLVISQDEVLDIISLYWFTESITSSIRLYHENGLIGFSLNPITQPTGCILFDNEIARPPRAWAEPTYNIVQWTRAAGGHFAAVENPEVLAKDIASFAKLI